MANAADIIVNLVAKTGSFTRGMDRGGKKLNKFKKSATSLSRTIAKLGGVLAGLGAGLSVAGIVRMTTEAIKLNDELGKFATRLGIATDELKLLQIAADLSGQKVSALTVGLQRMVRRINEAAIGTGEAKQAIIDLGLDAEKLAALSPDEIFRAIAERMDDVASQGQRIQLAFKLLDTEGVGLINTMALLNDEGFKAIEKSARDMNAVLSEFETSQFEAASDALTLMNLGFEGIKNTIALQLLPAVFLVRDGIVDIATEAGGADAQISAWTIKVVQTTAAVVAMFKSLLAIKRLVVAIGLRFVEFVLEPIEGAAQIFRNIRNGLATAANEAANFSARLFELFKRRPEDLEFVTVFKQVDPENTFIGAYRQGLIAAAEEQEDLLGDFKGLLGESEEYISLWGEARAAIDAAAEEIRKSREEQRKTSDELQRQLEIRRQAATAESELNARRTKLNALVQGGLSETERIAKKIILLNDELASGELIASEEERNAIIATRLRLIEDLVDAAQTEAGILSNTERAKALAGILQGAQLESEAIAEKIAIVNAAILAGEGDRNELMRVRLRLQEDLVAAQQEELEGATALTEIGIQAVRNMQSALADFFADIRGGFRNMLQAFINLLQRMVAELLARQVLLSFFRAFAKPGNFASKVIKDIEGRRHGGPLAAGQPAIVGEGGKPELFVPNVAGRIIPSGKFGGVTVTHNITVNGADPERTAEILVPLLARNRQQTLVELAALQAKGRF